MKWFIEDNDLKEKVQATIIQRMFKQISKNRAPFANEENTLIYTHGSKFSLTQKNCEGDKRISCDMTPSRAEAIMPIDSIARADFAEQSKKIESLVIQMHDNFEKSAVETLTQSTEDQEPEVVELRDPHSLANGLLKMLDDIELSLDENLELVKPSLLMNKATQEAICRLMKNKEASKHYKHESDKILAKKRVIALEKHFNRILKYKLIDYDREAIINRKQQLS